VIVVAVASDGGRSSTMTSDGGERIDGGRESMMVAVCTKILATAATMIAIVRFKISEILTRCLSNLDGIC